MTQTNSTTGRSPRAALTAVLLLLAGAAVAAPPKSAAPADPYAGVPDFNVSGRYAEACMDLPLCGAWFDSPSCAGSCRKLMMFQFVRSRYGTTVLNNRTAVVAVESPEGEPVTVRDRARWRRCDLILPDVADSAEARAITSVLGIMLRGRADGAFTSVRTVELAAGFTEERVLAESAGLLKFRIRPLPTSSGNNAPELSNLLLPFPFLGTPYAYGADTLAYTPPEPAAEPWTAARTSGVLAVFTWSTYAAQREAGLKPE